jgi:hypothetical protein
MVENLEEERDINAYIQPVYFNERTGHITMNPPLATQPCPGGVIADEMGMVPTASWFYLTW